MELLNNFTDTIFLKESSNLEKQIEKLKQDRDNTFENNKNWIDHKIKDYEIGLEGEKRIAHELKYCDVGMYVLHDVMLKYGDITAQIDFIVITKGNIYLIESKYLTGDVHINKDGQFVIKYDYAGHTYLKPIYSPYTQATKHKLLIKKEWINRNSNLSFNKQEELFDMLGYKPLIVLSNPNAILNKKQAPKKVRKCTIRIDELINYIKRDINKYSKSLYKNKNEMEEIANTFLNNNINSYVSKYNDIAHKKRVQSNLKRYRSYMAKKMKGPKKWVFTDKQLEQILDEMPNDMKSLENILNINQIKYHGKRILQIINRA